MKADVDGLWLAGRAREVGEEEEEKGEREREEEERSVRMPAIVGMP